MSTSTRPVPVSRPTQIAAVPWAEPIWAEGEELRAAAAVWVIDDGDARIAIDPARSRRRHPPLRRRRAAHQAAFAAVLDAAGMPRESFTLAIATHMEGIGMWAWRNDDGSWSPFFPSAPILVAQRELDAIDAGASVSRSTRRSPSSSAQGALQGGRRRRAVTEHVSVEHVGAHTPGHLFVRVASDGEQAIMVGHLAVSPLHLVTGPCPQQHPHPDAAQARIEKLLTEDAVVIGPLWPAPAAGRWNGTALVPVLA